MFNISSIKNNKNFIILFDQGIVSGCNFIFGILLARLLGADLFGIYSVSWLILLFCSGIHQSFIISPMLTLIPCSKKKFIDIRNVILLHFIFSIMTFVFINFSLNIYIRVVPEWKLSEYILIISLVVVVFLNQDFLRRLFFVTDQVKLSVISDLIFNIIRFILLLAVYYRFNLTLNTIYSILVISYAVSVIIFISKIKKCMNFEKLHTFKAYLKNNWKFSKWLVGGAILQWASGNYFSIAGGLIIGSWVVGYVRIMQNLVGFLNVVLLAFENIVPIKMISIYSKKGLRSVLLYALKVLSYIEIPLIFVLMLSLQFSEEIVMIAYGKDYTEHSYLLSWFIILYIFIFISSQFRFILRTLNDTKFIFINYILGSLIGIVLSRIIIKNIGLVGVPFGMILVQVVSCLFFVFMIVIKRRRYA